MKRQDASSPAPIVTAHFALIDQARCPGETDEDVDRRLEAEAAAADPMPGGQLYHDDLLGSDPTGRGY